MQEDITESNKLDIYFEWLTTVYVDVLDYLFLWRYVGEENKQIRSEEDIKNKAKEIIGHIREHGTNRDIIKLLGGDKIEEYIIPAQKKMIASFFSEIGRSIKEIDNIDEDKLEDYSYLYRKYERKKIRSRMFKEKIVEIEKPNRQNRKSFVGTVKLVSEKKEDESLVRTQRYIAGAKKNVEFEEFKKTTGIEDRDPVKFNQFVDEITDIKLSDSDKQLLYLYIAHILYNRKIKDSIFDLSQKNRIKGIIGKVYLEGAYMERRNNLISGTDLELTSEMIEKLELDEKEKACIKNHIVDLNNKTKGTKSKTKQIQIISDFLGEKVDGQKRCGNKDRFKKAFVKVIQSNFRNTTNSQ